MTKNNQDLEVPLTSSSNFEDTGKANLEDSTNHQEEKKTIINSDETNIKDNSENANEVNPSDSIKADSKNDENYRLAGRPPLTTLVLLAVGPLISQLVSSLYGIVTTIWVSRALGEMGMAAVSLFTNIDNVGRAFGYFMNCSASQKIASLFGQKKANEAGQVICDLFRCSIISGMIVPALLIPVAKPLGKWFGADDEILKMGVDYIVVLLSCSTVSVLFLMFCGCLQAEGRTFFVSVAQISSFVMNMALFCPLFLLVFHMGTGGAALATICSEAIPTIVIFFLYFFQKDEEAEEGELEDIQEPILNNNDEGSNSIKFHKKEKTHRKSCNPFKIKLACKPKLSGLFKKFSPHTWPALSVGVSQLASNCSRSIPSILQRKFMGMITQNSDKTSFTDAMSGFNCVIRIAQFTDSLRLAISMSLLPTSSYAYSASLYKRFLLLIFHGSWINLVWGGLSYVLIYTCAKPIAMIFSNGESFIRAAVPMMRNTITEAPICWVRYIIQTLLQSLSFGGSSTVFSVLSYFVVNIGTYCLLYYTDKTDVPRMMYAYSISAAISIFIGAFFVIKPIRTIYLKIKENNEENKQINLYGNAEKDSCQTTENHVFKDPANEDSKETNEIPEC